MRVLIAVLGFTLAFQSLVLAETPAQRGARATAAQSQAATAQSNAAAQGRRANDAAAQNAAMQRQRETEAAAQNAIMQRQRDAAARKPK